MPEWLTPLVTTLIAALTPVLIAGAKALAPAFPRRLIPILAPILGAALEIVGYYAGLTAGNPLVGALLGAVGVWLRELVDQLRQMLRDGSVQ